MKVRLIELPRCSWKWEIVGESPTTTTGNRFRSSRLALEDARRFAELHRVPLDETYEIISMAAIPGKPGFATCEGVIVLANPPEDMETAMIDEKDELLDDANGAAEALAEILGVETETIVETLEDGSRFVKVQVKEPVPAASDAPPASPRP